MPRQTHFLVQTIAPVTGDRSKTDQFKAATPIVCRSEHGACRTAEFRLLPPAEAASSAKMIFLT